MSAWSCPSYPSGLRLAGRRVLVVGGGHVAQRRVPALIAAGADVVVVSPEVTPAIEGLAGPARSAGSARLPGRRPEGAWYVIAATDDPGQRRVSAAPSAPDLLRAHDDATRATAWTPARPARGGDGRGARQPGAAPVRGACATRSSTACGTAGGPTSATDARGPLSAAARRPGADHRGRPPGADGGRRRGRRPARAARAAGRAARRRGADRRREAAARASRTGRDQPGPRRPCEGRQAGGALQGRRPFVFGRGYEEVMACREAGCPHRRPRVTSPISVPARAGIPVTHRGVAHEFTVVSGHLPPGTPSPWSTGTRSPGSRHLVLLMAVQNVPAIAAALIDGGRSRTRRSRSSTRARSGGAHRARRRSAALAEDCRARGPAARDHRDRRGRRGGAPRTRYG